MKQKWIDAFMDTAERFAQLSSAVRLKVGAVVVKDNRIVSIGYNGTHMEKSGQGEFDCKDWFMCFKKLPKEQVEALSKQP